jgi:acyl-CoA reductase-like NAD-dependent aldehyde dehydrogenase
MFVSILIIENNYFLRLIAIIHKHAKIVFGGKSDASERYLAPTCIDYGNDLVRFAKSDIMQDEIFGPIFPVCRYSKFEDALQFARSLPTGKPLALYFFSQNQANIQAIKSRTTSGGLVINDVLMHLVNHDLPFGGVGASGMGSYHGERSFNTFTHEKVAFFFVCVCVVCRRLRLRLCAHLLLSFLHFAGCAGEISPVGLVYFHETTIGCSIPSVHPI